MIHNSAKRILKESPDTKVKRLNSDKQQKRKRASKESEQKRKSREWRIRKLQREKKRIATGTIVIRGSFSQSDEKRFGVLSNRQCCAMSASAIMKAIQLPPETWTTATINDVVLNGHQLYCTVRQKAATCSSITLRL